jgi:hypothetical protein
LGIGIGYWQHFHIGNINLIGRARSFSFAQASSLRFDFPSLKPSRCRIDALADHQQQFTRFIPERTPEKMMQKEDPGGNRGPLYSLYRDYQSTGRAASSVRHACQDATSCQSGASPPERWTDKESPCG